MSNTAYRLFKKLNGELILQASRLDYDNGFLHKWVDLETIYEQDSKNYILKKYNITTLSYLDVIRIIRQSVSSFGLKEARDLYNVIEGGLTYKVYNINSEQLKTLQKSFICEEVKE